MWGSSMCLRPSGRPKASSLHSNDRYCAQEEHYEENEECLSHCPFLESQRRQRKNYTSKLHELALVLPLPLGLKTGSKKLTKKEILIHILHYIQYLQRNIDVVKALLRFHTTDGEGNSGGLGQNFPGGSARQRHCTPSSSPPHSYKSSLQGASWEPRKKKLTQASERQTRAKNPRRCLALDKSKKQATRSPGQKREKVEGTASPPRCPDSYFHSKAASSLPQGCCRPNSARDDGPSLASGALQGAERACFLNRTQYHPRQKPVLCDSSEEVDKEAPDADPWLPAWTPEGSPHGSPVTSRLPQVDKWYVNGHLMEVLGLSPSLFNSPGKLLPEEMLEDGSEFLTQALFEEAFSEDPMSSFSACMMEVPQEKDTPSGAPEDPPNSQGLHQSSVLLDRLSPSENGKAASSVSSENTDTDLNAELTWRQQDAQVDREHPKSTSEEDRDYTWIPTRWALTLPLARRKDPAGRGPVKPRKNKQAPCSTQTKKKCVNGFIMFCRMNRKQYIRACPGTASTAATKELAHLWRQMTEQERRPYCIKARRFSRQHNRIVKQESSSSDDEDWGIPKPFYQLLADKARSSSGPTSRLSHHKWEGNSTSPLLPHHLAAPIAPLKSGAKEEDNFPSWACHPC